MHVEVLRNETWLLLNVVVFVKNTNSCYKYQERNVTICQNSRTVLFLIIHDDLV